MEDSEEDRETGTRPDKPPAGPVGPRRSQRPSRGHGRYSPELWETDSCQRAHSSPAKAEKPNKVRKTKPQEKRQRSASPRPLLSSPNTETPAILSGLLSDLIH